MININVRQLKKFAVELGVAVATFALTYAVDNVASLELTPNAQAMVVLVVQVALQAVRRIGRDSMAGGPPAA